MPQGLDLQLSAGGGGWGKKEAQQPPRTTTHAQLGTGQGAGQAFSSLFPLHLGFFG